MSNRDEEAWNAIKETAARGGTVREMEQAAHDVLLGRGHGDDAFVCHVDESGGLADDEGIAHCMVCGERFKGEEKAEVTLKADPSEYHRHLIIHQSCYDPEKHEVA